MVGGFEIPAGWFQSVQPAFVILLAPLFSMLWVRLARRQLDPAAPLKFAFGLLLMGLGLPVHGRRGQHRRGRRAIARPTC